jgi:hypothetical protein
MAGWMTALVVHARFQEASRLASELSNLLESIGEPTLTVALLYAALLAKYQAGAARLQASTSMPATIAVTVDPITLADRVDVFSGATGLTTRGCLNLNGDNAIWFFNFSIPGDVVEIRNTGGPPLRLDQNGD